MRVPFLFCRYSAQIDGDELDQAGLLQALSDIQGQFLPHGKTAEREGRNDVVVMTPRRERIGGEMVVRWAIGHKPGHRTVTSYDAGDQEIRQRVRPDDHILQCHFIALPRLKVLAVTDQQSALNMGAKVALSRTRSAFKFMEDGQFAFWFLEPGDVSAMMAEVDLKEYSYTVRRINPTPPGALAEALDASMRDEGIGKQSGIAKPVEGGAMHQEGGIIAKSVELAEGGYGVIGFKGETDGGHIAQIRKPPFSMEKSKNLLQMEKEQPLRVLVEEERVDEIAASVVAELVRFYDRDAAPRHPQELA